MGIVQKNNELNNSSDVYEAQHQQALQHANLNNKIHYNSNETDQVTSNQIQQTLK